MSQRNKIIIIIVGALLIFGLFVAIVFDLFPSKEEPQQEETAQVEVDLSFLEDEETLLPEDSIFDASNRDEFESLAPGVIGEESISALEREAQDLAEFFIERFGTYSSDAQYAYIDDLEGFMTQEMQAWTESFKQQQPKTRGYFAITSDIATINTETFSLSSQEAEFSVLLNRTQESGNAVDQYQQQATVNLEQNRQGTWKVSGVYWGERVAK
jgi:hypothetical protein